MTKGVAANGPGFGIIFIDISGPEQEVITIKSACTTKSGSRGNFRIIIGRNFDVWTGTVCSPTSRGAIGFVNGLVNQKQLCVTSCEKLYCLATSIQPTVASIESEIIATNQTTSIIKIAIQSAATHHAVSSGFFRLPLRHQEDITSDQNAIIKQYIRRRSSFHQRYIPLEDSGSAIVTKNHKVISTLFDQNGIRIESEDQIGISTNGIYRGFS